MKSYKPSILLVRQNTSITNNAALILIVAGYKGQQVQGRTFLMKQSCGNFKPSLVVGLVSRMFCNYSISVPSKKVYLSGDMEFENLGIGTENTDKQAILSSFSSFRVLSS